MTLQLELHNLESEKTKYVNIGQSGLNFVGFNFTLEQIKVSDNNIQKFKDRVLEKIKIEDFPAWFF